MSVVINTNTTATMAAANLAKSNELLQQSLNRLSSGSRITSAKDDAGGLAVSMKLASTVHRQAAVSNNLANATSYLQTQDGALAVVGKILNRMSELKTLASDPTKNSDDLANYDSEFSQLQSEITSLAAEKFNGIALFGNSNMSVGVDAEVGGTNENFGDISLLGSTAFSPFSDNFASLSNWTNLSSGGGASAHTTGNTLVMDGAMGLAEVKSQQSFSGAFSISFDAAFPGGTGNEIAVKLGNSTLSDVTQYDVSGTGNHSIRIDVDGQGTATTYIDGSSTAFSTLTGLTDTSGQLDLSNFGFETSIVSNFAVTSVNNSNVSAVTSASGLAGLGLSTITDALKDLASFRASNGAQQSRLAFAAEALTVNQANTEAANSRISDVDVAQESTQLARYNILVQAGTAMLAQANQSSQIALKLLG